MMLKYLIYPLICSVLLIMGCDPLVEDKIDIGGPPNPTFEIIAGGTPNDFTLINTTTDAFLTKWDLGEGGKAEGEQVDAYFPFAGTYEITMTAFNRGGHSTATGTIEVTEDDPNACSGNFRLLTGCNTKVWKLAPEANAMQIGPSLGEVWWGNSEADVGTRFCHFDDEYIFKASGEYEYDNKGDFWADDNGSGVVWPDDLGLDVGCNQGSDWPDKYKAWDSGVHSFSVTENSITLTGLGAWLGLYKVGTADEVVEPQPSTTYSILEISEDRMVLFTDYGWGVWQFTLVAE